MGKHLDRPAPPRRRRTESKPVEDSEYDDVVPTRDDPMLRSLSEAVGGPLGTHAITGTRFKGFFTTDRVLIILTIIAALLSVLVKSHCRVNGWSTPDHFYAMCYSDWGELFSTRGWDSGQYPFITEGVRAEYPVLLGLIASFTAWLVPGSGTSIARDAAYFDINAIFVAVTWVITVLATARMARGRRWDAAMVALAPATILSATINWDMWAVMLAALAMLAFARNRPILAGVMLGLGIAVKLYPLLILGAIFLLALRTRRWRAAIVVITTTALSWLLVNLPFMIRDWEGWRYFFDFTSERDAGFSSVWYILNISAGGAGGPTLPVESINALSQGLMLLCCVGIAILALTAKRRPRMGQLVFLIVIAFVLTNKVYSPQFVLWLVPLFVLARPRWRSFLVWQAIEVLHWVAIWLHLANATSGGAATYNLDQNVYVLAVVAHMVALLWLAWAVIRDILDPNGDPIRQGGVDDPIGGPFNNAPDRWPWPLRLQARREPTHAAPAEAAVVGELESSTRP